jgi:hypothetical protein
MGVPKMDLGVNWPGGIPHFGRPLTACPLRPPSADLVRFQRVQLSHHTWSLCDERWAVYLDWLQNSGEPRAVLDRQLAACLFSVSIPICSGVSQQEPALRFQLGIAALPQPVGSAKLEAGFPLAQRNIACLSLLKLAARAQGCWLPSHPPAALSNAPPSLRITLHQDRFPCRAPTSLKTPFSL